MLPFPQFSPDWVPTEPAKSAYAWATPIARNPLTRQNVERASPLVRSQLLLRHLIDGVAERRSVPLGGRQRPLIHAAETRRVVRGRCVPPAWTKCVQSNARSAARDLELGHPPTMETCPTCAGPLPIQVTESNDHVTYCPHCDTPIYRVEFSD